jgi:hypothetical protein
MWFFKIGGGVYKHANLYQTTLLDKMGGWQILLLKCFFLEILAKCVHVSTTFQ